MWRKLVQKTAGEQYGGGFDELQDMINTIKRNKRVQKKYDHMMIGGVWCQYSKRKLGGQKEI
jgi:hypothetical protein